MNPIAYPEIASGQNALAAKADLDAITEDQKLIDKKCLRVNSDMIDIVNATIRQGDALKRLAGRDQMTFSFIHRLGTKLPWGEGTGAELEQSRFKAAKARLAMANAVGGQVKDWGDLQPANRRAALREMGFLSIIDRDDMETAPSIRDPFTCWRRDLARYKQAWMKVDRLTPLANRTPAQLEGVLEDTQWIEEVREQAKQLLAK